MELKVIQADQSLTHVSIDGRLDIEGVNTIEDRFIAEVTTRRRPSIVDLSGVDFIASRGMGMLIAGAKALQRHGAKLVVLRPQPPVGQALRAAGIDEVIPIAEEREKALELLL